MASNPSELQFIDQGGLSNNLVQPKWLTGEPTDRHSAEINKGQGGLSVVTLKSQHNGEVVN